ncbi:phytanoyl-CoA dioxygenase family protein [Saccharopolyspora sp. K220]|uniref:phytanoyl-CoA dioxygenase family protein n=1 Tax=Saccharopolyspora soli TaxID=2926618 RepID=UPI001F58CD08|nr:phytanoyl-CoA dioxygenase family protein [Saccharopolyspora soli]MCI2418238.1 phytanoyl-CoA dioxygenase family protein [Saccharopolyspora soli]
MLHEQQISDYRERGFIAVDDVLTPAEVAEIRAATDEFVERSRAVTTHTDVFDLEPGHSAESPRLRRLKQPHLRHGAFDRALRNDRILDIVGQLIGPGIRFQNTKLNLKSPEFGSPVEWHQDWAFYPHTNDDVLAVGIAIDEMALCNGCLMVVPGSHRGPVLSHHQDGYFVGAVPPDGLADRAVPIELRAGGISVHHARLLHGSAPNTSDRPRRFLLFEYAAADAWPLVGNPGWRELNDKLLRGEPVVSPRLEPVPVRLPEPTHDRGGSIYETQSAVKQRAFQQVRRGSSG